MTYLLILIAYALVMIVLGAYLARRVNQSSDFFVAGRGLSAGLLCTTLLAANIGAGSTVGATGLGYRDGLTAWWWVGSAALGSLILAFTVGPRIWRVAKAENLYTVGDYLAHRYDRRVRGVVALLLWVGALAILAGQLIAMEQIFRVTANLNKTAGCLLAAVVIMVYSAAGGLHATARVNILQLIVKLVGFAAAFVYLLTLNGGWAGITAKVATNVVPASYFSLWGDGTAALGYLVLLVPPFIVSPGLLQKIFGAQDESAVRRGVAFNALGLFAFAIIPVALGIIARGYYPQLASRELALPELLTHALPVWLGGLVLGALFSAELSAADAVLFMLTTSLSKDLYKSFLRPAATDQQLLKVARVTTVVCALLGAALALQFGSVVAALKIFYTLLSAALLLPLIAGLYLPQVGTNAALAALTVSVTVTFTLDRLTAGKGWHSLPPLLIATVLGALTMAVVTFWQQQAGRRQDRARP